MVDATWSLVQPPRLPAVSSTEIIASLSDTDAMRPVFPLQSGADEAIYTTSTQRITSFRVHLQEDAYTNSESLERYPELRDNQNQDQTYDTLLRCHSTFRCP